MLHISVLQAIGSLDVGTGESSIFLFNGTRYILDNIFKGWLDHAGLWNPRFANHSYARIRELETGKLIANVSETIATSFVSAFVDHGQPGGDVLWLSANNGDRSGATQYGWQKNFPNQSGVLAMRSTDLRSFTTSMAVPTGGPGQHAGTCNTEVARVDVAVPGLPPHRYVMILEHFAKDETNDFLVNNNADGDLSHGWISANQPKFRAAPGGGPSIRFEGGRYYVITGGRQVMLCRSKDLGLKDPWQCRLMVSPTGRGGALGPGDGAIAPFAGFAKDAHRKGFDVMSQHLDEWDWNSNDADVCCSGGSVGAFVIWGASTQGGASKLPPGSPSFTNAIGYRNSTLADLLCSFFHPNA